MLWTTSIGALEMNERLGVRPWLAHTQADLARTLLARGARGDLDRASELSRAALETFDALGMEGPADRLSDSRRQAELADSHRPNVGNHDLLYGDVARGLKLPERPHADEHPLRLGRALLRHWILPREARVAASLPQVAQGRSALRSPASVRAGRAGLPDGSRDAPGSARRREPHISTSSGSRPAVPWPRRPLPARA